MSKAGRTWFPLDVNYTSDDRVLEAGERAGWLYLAMLGKIYSARHHGVITRREIGTLGVPGWEKRMTELVRVGLVKSLDTEVYLIPAWQEWQGNPQRAAYMRQWRAKRARDDMRIVGQEDGDDER